MKKFLSASLLFSALCSLSIAQDVTFFFETDDPTIDDPTIITGGDLVLTETGSGPTDNWLSDRFETPESTFEVQSIPTYGTLTVIAGALNGDLNVTGSGLADGGSGLNVSGEGLTFQFSQAVTIIALDFASFTSGASDSVELFRGVTSLGTFSNGTVVGGVADFTDTNSVTASISLAPNELFTLSYSTGDGYHLEELSFSVVPEPGTYALLAGFCGLVFVMLKRRRD